MMMKTVGTLAKLKRFGDLDTRELDFWRAALAQNEACQRAFMTPTFVEAVAKNDDKVRVLVIFANAQLVGLLPLRQHHAWIGLMGVFEPVAGEMTDYFGAIVAPGVTLNIDSVLRSAGVGALVFSHLDESQSGFGLTGENTRVGLRTVIQGAADEHWEQLRKVDRKLVADTERRERRLFTEHGQLTFELQSTSPVADLEELMRLKKAQYTRTGKHDAVLFNESNAALLRALLTASATECAGLLSVLRVAGKLVAAHFGLRCNGVLHYWFPVYVKEYAAFSPSRILYRHILTEGGALGIHVLDRGEGDTPAKRDFSNAEHLYASGVWWPKGIKGLLARLSLSVMWRWKNFVG